MAADFDSYIEEHEGSDFDSYISEHDDKNKSFGRRALEGVASVANTVDSYTGAPARRFVGEIQQGKGVGDAASAGWDQVGEDPSTAPTGKDIVRATGLPDVEAYGRPSLHGVAGFVTEAVLDPVNLIFPGGKLAAKGISKGAGMAVNALEAAPKVVAKGLSKAGDGAAWVGRKAVSGGLGVPEEAQLKYLANHDRLKDIVDVKSGVEPIKDAMDETLQPLVSRVSSTKEKLPIARSAQTEEMARIRDAVTDQKDALRLAEEQALGEGAAKVSGAVQRLDKDVKAGSAKAFEILDQEGVKVKTQALKADMTRGIKLLEERAITDEQIAAVDLMKRYRERLDKWGGEIPGGEAKRILQALDSEIKRVAPGEVGRMAKDDQLLATLRRRIDEPLKQSKAYADQMQGVAADTRLLMQNKDLATEGAAARALRAAQKMTGKDKADAIRALSEKYGDDFLSMADRSRLPEYQKLKGLLQRYRSARKGHGVKALETELRAAGDDLAPFKAIAPNELGTKSGAQSAILNQMRPKTANIDTGRAIQQMDERFGKNFGQQIDDLKTVSAFDKDFTRGSANTNFWTYALGGAGALVGGPVGGLAGMTGGALTGRILVDKFGPQTARIILDQLPALQKASPVNWLNSLQVPPAVKKELQRDLVYHHVLTKGQAANQGARAVTREAGPMSRVAEGDQDRGVAGENPAQQRYISEEEAQRKFIEEGR